MQMLCTESVTVTGLCLSNQLLPVQTLVCVFFFAQLTQKYCYIVYT